MTTDLAHAQDHTALRTESFTFSSPADAEAWLAELERTEVVVRVEQSALAGGRVAVVAYLEEHQAATAPTRPATSAGSTSSVPEPRSERPQPQPRVCGSCRAELPAPAGSGRPRRYCSDTCRSRASRARHPTIPKCGLRAGGWPCDEPAVVMVREVDENHRSGWSPHGLAIPACEPCADLVEQFAVRQPSVMFVGQQPVLEYLASRAGRQW